MTSPDDLPPESRRGRRADSTAEPSRHSTNVAPERETIQSIVAQGDDERWQLARKTARAVFREPALVTPRRLALLGEEGLAAFVSEVRSLAKGYIRRERERPAKSSASGPDSADPALQAPVTNVAQRPKKPRKPAALGLVQAQTPSMLETLKRRLKMSAGIRAFIFDSVIYSAVAAAVLMLALAVRYLHYTSL